MSTVIEDRDKQKYERIQRELNDDRPLPTDIGILGGPEYVIADVYVAEIARATKLSGPAVSRIFNGDRTPRLENAVAIAAYLQRRLKRKFRVEDLMSVIADRVKEGRGKRRAS